MIILALWFITLVATLFIFGICMNEFEIPLNPVSTFLVFCPILNTLYLIFLLFKAIRFTKENFIDWVKETFYL